MRLIDADKLKETLLHYNYTTEHNQIFRYIDEQPTDESGYNAGYKEAFEETLATVIFYADMWDGIYQAIDTLEERWREKQNENKYE